jgi:Na+/H+-translocating membrane pyrophosphatase
MAAAESVAPELVAPELVALELVALVVVLVVVVHRPERLTRRRHILAGLRSAAVRAAGLTIAARGNNRLTSSRALTR